MNNNLSKIYSARDKSTSKQKSFLSKLKQADKITPALLMMGAIPMASHAQILSDAGLICNNSQSDCKLNDRSFNKINTRSYTIASRLNFKATGSYGYNALDIDCDGDTDFFTFFLQSRRSISTIASGANIYNRLLGINGMSVGSAAASFEGVQNTFRTATFGGSFQTGYVRNNAFASGASIGASDQFFKGNYNNAATVLASATTYSLYGNTRTGSLSRDGTFNVGQSGLVGIKFDSNGNNHFGFIEIMINKPGDPTILNTAYNPIPNEPATIAVGACAPPPAIPTMGEWGLISLGLLLLSFGTTMIMRKEGAMSTNAGDVQLNFSKPLFNLDIFKKSLLIALGLGLMLSLGSVALTGTLTLVDIIGGAIATPILAYWLHLVSMYKKEEEK